MLQHTDSVDVNRNDDISRIKPSGKMMQIVEIKIAFRLMSVASDSVKSSPAMSDWYRLTMI